MDDHFRLLFTLVQGTKLDPFVIGYLIKLLPTAGEYRSVTIENVMLMEVNPK
jgi:hypothetical protein